MGSRRHLPALATAMGLVAAGVVAAGAWARGMWGLLAGSMLVALWLGAIVGRAMAMPRDTTPRAAATRPDADALVLRALLDAAPTPLLAIEGTAARALNRAARGLFATDDRILPAPAALADPATSRLHHEGRRWRIDRVAMPGGGGVAALIDVEQEERVAEARAAADLIQVLGHELLNGLAPIVSLAESGMTAVSAPRADVTLLREIFGTLARRADGLLRFAEAYRSLARLPAPTRRAAHLREMTDDLARLFAGRWPHIALSTVADPGEWPLDRDQVAQAVWALLQNAAEATAGAPEPQVRLRVQAGADHLTIDVEDNGGGVPAGKAGHIFRPFHTTKADGTGVGLSLARQVALAHGGTLTLVPVAPTTFRLVLPAQG